MPLVGAWGTLMLLVGAWGIPTEGDLAVQTDTGETCQLATIAATSSLHRGKTYDHKALTKHRSKEL